MERLIQIVAWFCLVALAQGAPASVSLHNGYTEAVWVQGTFSNFEETLATVSRYMAPGATIVLMDTKQPVDRFDINVNGIAAGGKAGACPMFINGAGHNLITWAYDPAVEVGELSFSVETGDNGERMEEDYFRAIVAKILTLGITVGAGIFASRFLWRLFQRLLGGPTFSE